MTPLFEQIPGLATYQPSFLILAVLSMITLLQNFLTAPLSFLKEEQVPGMPLRLDHGSLSFRALRTYQNSAESLPAFIAALLIAIIAGAPAAFVNIAAAVYLGARVLFWALYYSGIGAAAGGPRTMAFVICLLANIAIAGVAIWAVV